MTTYKVTAPTGFDGHEAGEEFEAEMDPWMEEWAVTRGAVEIVKTTGKKAKAKEADDE